MSAAKRLIESSDVEEKDAEMRHELIRMTLCGESPEKIAEKVYDFAVENHPEWWTIYGSGPDADADADEDDLIEWTADMLTDKIIDMYNITDIDARSNGIGLEIYNHARAGLT